MWVLQQPSSSHLYKRLGAVQEIGKSGLVEWIRQLNWFGQRVERAHGLHPLYAQSRMGGIGISRGWCECVPIFARIFVIDLAEAVIGVLLQDFRIPNVGPVLLRGESGHQTQAAAQFPRRVIFLSSFEQNGIASQMLEQQAVGIPGLMVIDGEQE